MNNTPQCFGCQKIITSKQDANILYFLGVKLRMFCNNCYSSKERALARHFVYVPKFPVNSSMFSFVMILANVVVFPVWLIIALFSDTPVSGKVMMIIYITIAVIWLWSMYLRAKKVLSEIPQA